MTTVINFKTDKKIKTQAQKIAEEIGLNLSDILNIYLREFITKKEIHISLAEEPSDYLIDAIESAEKEFKNKKKEDFKDFDEAIAYLDKFID